MNKKLCLILSKMSNCSILRNDRSFSCYNPEELISLIEGWNESFKNNKINVNPDIVGSWNKLQVEIKRYNDSCNKSLQLDPELITKILWCAMNEKLKGICTTESCWIDVKEIMQKVKEKYPSLYSNINNYVFKPKGTRERIGWLSTIEIVNVMKQYEKAHKDFKFIDCVASDHFKLYPDEQPNFTELRKTKKYAAVVFNLDETDQSGSHWIAVFFDFSGPELIAEHFDSTGEPPIKNILQFIKSCHPYEILINKFQHQKGNTECGVFSLFYIQKRLEGHKFEDFQKDRIADKIMEDYRKIFFRPFSTKISLTPSS